jgi:hypothetical protein
MTERCKHNPCCGDYLDCKPPPQFKPRETYDDYQARTTNDAPAPAPSGSGVRVKPLEWVGYPNSWPVRAQTDLGDYCIVYDGRSVEAALGWRVWSTGEMPETPAGSYEEAQALAEADLLARINSCLASDASPRGDAVAWGSKAALAMIEAGCSATIHPYPPPLDPIALYAHPAPATVEMREALQAAEPFVELLHSLTGEKRARAIVWKALKQIRAALAPATEGRKG